MKIKSGFILRKVADSYVVVAVGNRVKDFNGVINLNATGAFLWQLLEKGISEEDLTKKFLKEYDVDKEILEQDLKVFLKKIREAGLTEE
ncbi:MAG: PqqD family protein [Clostridia bacterium]|nr:PqqD family protein [Clostridia bacterium]